MSTPSILYQNLLAEAAAGRGSGEILAWGSSAVPDVANKTFDLTTINIMSDLGADADNKFNGWILKFTADGGGEYLITDWVASSDLASTFERPRVSDTGSWEIRRTLAADAFDPTTPIRYATNGRPYQTFLDNAPNTGLIVRAYLPNALTDGGFERGDLAQYWTLLGITGTGTVALNATAPLIGKYDCKFTRGDQPWVGAQQPGNIDLQKGQTYAVRFKARGDGGTVSDFRVSFAHLNGTTMNVTFEEINSADDTATPNIWKPAIPATAAWEVVLFTVSDNVTAEQWKTTLQQYDTTNVFIDELYIWKVTTPDTMAISNHNFAGGFSAGSEVYALMCDDNLASFNVGVEASKLIDLDADVAVNGTASIYETFTPTTEPYPIFQIIFAARPSITHEFGEIWLGQRWDWPKFKSGDWDPIDGEMVARVVGTEGGIEVIEDEYEKQRRSGEIIRITSAEAANWEAFEKYCKLSKPFWYYHDRFTALGQDPELLFMRNSSKPRLPVVNTRFNANYSFIEVL